MLNNVLTDMVSSPLYPLKGRIAFSITREKFVTNTPLRGQGVSKYDNNLFL